jgi:hypothetical protein
MRGVLQPGPQLALQDDTEGLTITDKTFCVPDIALETARHVRSSLFTFTQDRGVAK